MNPFVLGFLRGLGTVLLAAALSYLADGTHLQGIVTPAIASLIAVIALALEHQLSPTGTALFGAVDA